jgi:hypothetical protein
VLLGATSESKKELIGFEVRVRESAQSWREQLVDLKSRGQSIAPEVAVGDGALGFWKAVEEIFPRHASPAFVGCAKLSNVLEDPALGAAENEAGLARNLLGAEPGRR